MIARAIVAAAILFAAYSLALSVRPVRARFTALQGQWQANLVKAEEYALAEPRRPGAVVGSSLAVRLAFSPLSGEFFNLALAGDGPLTGLEVIRRSGIFPRVLLIETNLVLRERNPVILDHLAQPLRPELQTKLWSLRERYQPANLLAGNFGQRIVHAVLAAPRQLFGSRDAAASTREAEAENNARLFAAELARQREQYTQAPDPVLLEERIAELKQGVAELERAGVRCILLELPVDASLLRLPGTTVTQAALARAFPADRYRWLRPEPDRRYETTDGLHLTLPEAHALGARIRAELAPIF